MPNNSNKEKKKIEEVCFVKENEKKKKRENGTKQTESPHTLECVFNIVARLLLEVPAAIEYSTAPLSPMSTRHHGSVR